MPQRHSRGTEPLPRRVVGDACLLCRLGKIGLQHQLDPAGSDLTLAESTAGVYGLICTCKLNLSPTESQNFILIWFSWQLDILWLGPKWLVHGPLFCIADDHVKSIVCLGCQARVGMLCAAMNPLISSVSAIIQESCNQLWTQTLSIRRHLRPQSHTVIFQRFMLEGDNYAFSG